MKEEKTVQLITEFQANITKRFDAIDRRFDGVTERLDSVDTRLAQHDEQLDALGKQLGQHGDHFDDLNKRLGSMQVRNDDQFMRQYRHIETRCDAIEAVMATRVQTEQVIEIVDGVAKVVKDDHMEVTSMMAKIERIKARIQRLEGHTPQLEQDAA